MRQVDFELLVENAPDIIYTTDLYGKCTYANKSATKKLGYTNEELLGKTFKFLVNPLHQMRVEDGLYAHFSERKLESKSEFIVDRKDKSSFWVEQVIRTIYETDSQKIIKGFYGIVRDIDQRKRVELKLKLSTEYFTQITETISEVFYLYNILDKRYEYISPNCEKVLGANQGFFYSRKSHTKKFVHPEDKQILLAAEVKVNSGIPYDIDYRLLIDEKIVWINEKSFPIKNTNGKIHRNSGICRNISDIKVALDKNK